MHIASYNNNNNNNNTNNKTAPSDTFNKNRTLQKMAHDKYST